MWTYLLHPPREHAKNELLAGKFVWRFLSSFPPPAYVRNWRMRTIAPFHTCVKLESDKVHTYILWSRELGMPRYLNEALMCAPRLLLLLCKIVFFKTFRTVSSEAQKLLPIQYNSPPPSFLLPILVNWWKLTRLHNDQTASILLLYSTCFAS